ncbi:MAG: phage portal protein [bacterium]
MTKGTAFLLDSISGAVIKVESPRLLEGMIRPAEYFEVAKAVTEAAGSKRIREKYGTTLDGVMCAARPFDFYLYAYAATLNTYHSRAIRAKVKDIVGRPWEIVGDGPAGLKERIWTFFNTAFGEMTLGEGLGNVWTDYEALGNGFLEVIPNAKGEPAELAHIPATEVWIRLDGLGYVQQKNGEYAHFRKYGADPKLYAELPANDPLASGRERTSVIHFCRYFPWSLYYGIPPIMPAWNRLALMVLEAEYNLSFFNNNAIPDYAVILEGEWEDNAEDVIREYFKRHLKGQAHKTLALRSPQGGKITFEKLTSDLKEGSFRLLRIDCRDEILHAHGVPPQKVGIVETGKLGGNLASEQIIEYKNSIVTPGQEMVAGRLNRIIEIGFGTTDLYIQFEPYDTEDRRLNAEVDQIYINAGVRTPNEVRAERFPWTEPLEGGDEPRRAPAIGDLWNIDEALQGVQREIREAIPR